MDFFDKKKLLLASGGENDLADWRYYDAGGGTVYLYEYLGQGQEIDGKLFLDVPEHNGKSFIGSYSISGTANMPFYAQNKFDVIRLNNRPFLNNDASNAFCENPRLYSVFQFDSNIINMCNAFRNCTNLQVPGDYDFINFKYTLPPSVKDASNCFYNCRSLYSNIFIPKTITNAAYMFCACYNLPSSFNAVNLFQNCYYLQDAEAVFNGGMPYPINYVGTFANCYNLKSARHAFAVGTVARAYNMYKCFYDCRNLVYAPTRFSNVTNLDYAFYNCYSMNLAVDWDAFSHGQACHTADFAFYNARIPTAANFFYNCSELKHAYNTFGRIKFSNSRIVSNAFRNCKNLINAGGAFFSTSAIASDYTFAECPNLQTVANAFYNCTFLQYANDCFYNSNNIINATAVFFNCYNLKTNVALPNSIKYVDYAFHNCINIPVSPQTKFRNYTNLINASHCFSGCNQISNMYGVFTNCYNLQYADETVPYNVTQIAWCFRNCNSLTGNITIRSPRIGNIVNAFAGHNASLRKNIRIYFTYANGVNSATYNQFKANNVFKGTSGNAAGTNPMYNSTSNFYVYNLGAAPF